MIHELEPRRYGNIRPLLGDLAELQLCAPAVVEGECEGRVVVGDPDHPRSALITSPEGSYLVGDSSNMGFNDALREYVWDELFGSSEWELMYVTAVEDGWAEVLRQVAAPRELITIGRRHYLCSLVTIDWRELVPADHEVHLLDAELLDSPALSVPDHIRGWIDNNWGTSERFFARGFGMTTIHDDEIVSWSLTDCRSGDACEIGIHTHFAHRRRGLATVTAAAAVEHALAHGYRVVGWHCNDDNLGSIGTAERVGFQLDRSYETHYFYSEEAEELAERGWRAFQRERYEDTLAFYERVFLLRPDSPGFQYHLAARASAAIGDQQAALSYLRRAIETGWSAPEFTRSCPEFESLHETDEWTRVLGLMDDSAN